MEAKFSLDELEARSRQVSERKLLLFSKVSDIITNEKKTKNCFR
jgi:hypothetical protein